MARPSIYTEELATEICKRIAQGESVRSITKDEDMPVASTIFNWLLDSSKKKFLEQYETARNVQAELMFEELLEIADDSQKDIVGDDKSDGARVNAHRLRVDTRKWYLSKVLPKKYGDKMDITSGNKPLPIINVPSNNINAEDNADAEKDKNLPGRDISQQNHINSPLPDSIIPIGQDKETNEHSVGELSTSKEGS